MHGGRVVAKALAAHGVRYVFGLCGDHVNAVFDGCVDEDIPIVDTRHEAAAVQMAQGWSLATGHPGVAVVTGGPGLMNAVTPIADAKLAGIPLVVITSTIRQSEVGKGYPQDMDQMSVVAPVAVWADTVRSTEALLASVATALSMARVRRGPVVLQIPLDVQLARCRDQASVVEEIQAHPATGGLVEAALLLGRAERPVAILGEGAFWSGGWGLLRTDPADAVRELVEKARIPTFTMRAARGLIPDRHDLSFGAPNYLRGPGTVAFPRADALLVVGTELDIVLMFGNLAPNAKLIRVDADRERIGRHRAPDVALLGDEIATLERLTASAAAPPGRDAWIEEVGTAASDDEPALGDGAVHPAALAAHVGRAVGERGSISLDAGALALWAYDRVPATGPGRMLSTFTTPLGTLGPGLPFAMAAKLARPDEPSIALVGDGAFGFSAMELDTAARHGIDVKVVVGNDASWGIVRRQMELGFGRSVAATLADRRYDELAKSLGAQGERVDDARDLPAALDRLMKADGPALLDVKLDGSVDHPAMPFIAQMFAPEQG